MPSGSNLRKDALSVSCLGGANFFFSNQVVIGPQKNTHKKERKKKKTPTWKEICYLAKKNKQKKNREILLIQMVGSKVPHKSTVDVVPKV